MAKQRPRDSNSRRVDSSKERGSQTGATSRRGELFLGTFAAAAVAGILALIVGRGESDTRGPERPTWVQPLIKCLAQCAAIGTKTQENLDRIAVKGVAKQGRSPWRLPPEVCANTRRRCDVLSEAFCAGLQCQVNGSGILGTWFPLAGAIDPPEPTPDALNRTEAAYDSHVQCAARCASQAYLTVKLTSPPTLASIALAAARLSECGLVHLLGGAWEKDVFTRFAEASTRLRALPADAQAELKRAELRAKRTELFLPFEPSLPDPLATGVVPAVVAEYVGEPFSLDYVSLLNAKAGVAGTQDLHCDVPFFPRTSLSVHTALEDITESMGPTLFCPCTHSVTGWEEMDPGPATGEAVRFASSFRAAVRLTGSANARQCLGAAYVPKSLPAGMVTVYDGALLHSGLANTARIDRVVLNVNFAAPPGYEDVRNYTVSDPERARAETKSWRERSNDRNSAQERLKALQDWTASLPP